MRRFSILLAALLVVGVQAAEPLSPSDDPIQSLQLPDVSNAQASQSDKAWLVVCVPDNYRTDAESLRLLGEIRNAPADSPLRRWIDRCNVVVTPASDPINRERHGKYVAPGDLPAVWLQKPTGAVLYKCTRQTLPPDGYALGRELDYYSALDPVRTAQDSRAAHGPIDWVEQCPDACPDGNCPWQPPAQPYAEPTLPDSSIAYPMGPSLVPILVVIGGSIVVVLGLAVVAAGTAAFVVYRRR